MKLLDANTSYTGLGYGNRTGKVHIRTNFAYATGNESSLSRLVNGVRNTNSNMPRFKTEGNEEHYFEIEFDEAVFFDEITIRSNSATNLGDWRLEGKHHKDKEFRTLSIVEELRGNNSINVNRKDPIKYMYYRLVFLGSSLPLMYFREFEFKVGDAVFSFEDIELKENEESIVLTSLIEEKTHDTVGITIEDNKLVLDKKPNSDQYVSYGHWESMPLSIKGLHAGIDRVIFDLSHSGNINILARTSEDGIVFGDYQPFEEIRASKSVYVQLKIELYPNKVDRTTVIGTEEVLQELSEKNKYLRYTEEGLELNDLVTYKMKHNEDFEEEGYVNEFTLPIEKFKRIDSIDVY